MMSVFCILSLCSSLLRLVGVGLAYCMCRGLLVAIEIFDSLAFRVICFHGCVLIMGCCSVTLVPRP